MHRYVCMYTKICATNMYVCMYVYAHTHLNFARVFDLYIYIRMYTHTHTYTHLKDPHANQWWE